MLPRLQRPIVEDAVLHIGTAQQLDIGDGGEAAPTPSRRQLNSAAQIHLPGESLLGLPSASRHSPCAPELSRQEVEDAIRLADIEPTDDDCLHVITNPTRPVPP